MGFPTTLVTAIWRMSNKIRDDHFMLPGYHKCLFYACSKVYDSRHKIFPLVSAHWDLHELGFTSLTLRKIFPLSTQRKHWHKMFPLLTKRTNIKSSLYFNKGNIPLKYVKVCMTLSRDHFGYATHAGLPPRWKTPTNPEPSCNLAISQKCNEKRYFIFGRPTAACH